MAKQFLTLTRVFVYDADKKKAMKEQTITVRTDAIDSVRASNRLSKLLGRDPIRDEPAHRSTITLRGGDEIELAEKSGDVLAMLTAR